MNALKHALKSQLSRSHQVIRQTYGVKDLSKNPAFLGGFINYGYWKNISYQGGITNEQRIAASKDLYTHILQKLHITRMDRVLEVGCGQGHGCAHVLQEYQPKQLTGIDLTLEQIARAQCRYGGASQNLSFHVADGCNLPFENQSYTKIYTVEVAQYFTSMERFAHNAFRLLSPGGTLVLTAHFASNIAGYNRLKHLIPSVQENVDRMIPIQNVREAFKQAGFLETDFEDISQDVFPGLYAWRRMQPHDPWTEGLHTGFKEGHLGYYVLVLKKGV